jgi:hypothetical protein
LVYVLLSIQERFHEEEAGLVARREPYAPTTPPHAGKLRSIEQAKHPRTKFCIKGTMGTSKVFYKTKKVRTDRDPRIPKKKNFCLFGMYTVQVTDLDT